MMEIFLSFLVIVLVGYIAIKLDDYHRKSKKLNDTLHKTYNESMGEDRLRPEHELGRQLGRPYGDMVREFEEQTRIVEQQYWIHQQSIERQRGMITPGDLQKLKDIATAKSKPKDPETDVFSVSEQFKDIV